MQAHDRPHKNLRFALRVIWLLARGLSLIVALIILGGVVLLFGLSKVMNGERVKGLLVYHLQQAIRRPVHIQSAILTHKGVKISGVKILQKSPAPLLESDFALVTIKLKPLLLKKLELDDIKLVSPRIRVSRDEDGAWNFSDLFSSSVPARALAAGRFPVPFSLGADRIIIEDGTLEIEDRLRGTSVTVDKFGLDARRFSVTEPFSLLFQFDNVSKYDDREMRASVFFDGTVSLADFLWSEAYLRAARLKVVLNGEVLEGAGGIKGFPPTEGDVDLALPTLGPPQWRLLTDKPFSWTFPPSRCRLSAALSPEGSWIVKNLEWRVQSAALRAEGEIDWLRRRLAARLTVSDFSLEQARAYHDSLFTRQLGGDLSGEASVSGWFGAFALEKIRADWRGAQGRFTEARLLGGNLLLSASNDFASAVLTAEGAALEAYGNSFSNMRFSSSLNKGNLKIDQLSLKWSGQPLRLKARVLDVNDPKEVAISGTLERLNWNDAQRLIEGMGVNYSTHSFAEAETQEPAKPKPWVRAFKYVIPKKFPDTVGHIRVGHVTHNNFTFSDIDLVWDIRSVTPSLRRVNGDLRVGFGPGRINDIQAVQDSHKFLKIILLPYIYMHKMNNLSVLSAATAYPKTLDFHRIEGQYSVSRGAVSIRFAHVDSPQVIAFADGVADFGQERVDMSILTRLTRYRAPLPEWWVDQLGRPSIAFRVKGDLNRPELEPRLHKIASDEIEKAVEEGRRRAKVRFEAIEKLQTL